MRLQPRKIRPPDYKRSPLGVRGVSCAVSAFRQVCAVLVAPPFMCRPASDPEVQYLPCNRSQGIKDRNFLHNLALVNESHAVLTWQPDGPFPFLFGVLSTKKERLMISYRGFFLIMISLRSKRFLARLETLATQAKLWYALSTISKLEGLCTLYPALYAFSSPEPVVGRLQIKPSGSGDENALYVELQRTANECAGERRILRRPDQQKYTK